MAGTAHHYTHLTTWMGRPQRCYPQHQPYRRPGWAARWRLAATRPMHPPCCGIGRSPAQRPGLRHDNEECTQKYTSTIYHLSTICHLPYMPRVHDGAASQGGCGSGALRTRLLCLCGVRRGASGRGRASKAGSAHMSAAIVARSEPMKSRTRALAAAVCRARSSLPPLRSSVDGVVAWSPPTKQDVSELMAGHP
jgi:hypothetical protein